MCIASLMFASLLPTALAADAEATIVYQTEGYNEYQQQLAAARSGRHDQPGLASLRATLKDGRLRARQSAPTKSRRRRRPAGGARPGDGA